MPAQPIPTRPRLALVGTGGTIAATTQSSTGLTDYDITEGVHALLHAVPELQELAELECHQIFNVDSRAMSSLMLLELSQKLNELLARPDLDGVVLTHGTDTLEESAFFLHLTLKTDKPVVLTAAMRPASALSADGPLNLHNAVRVACCPQARGAGVLVLLNDQIHSARFLSKQHTTQVNAFGSPDAGPLGLVAAGRVRFATRCLLPHTLDSSFDVRGLSALPKVQIFYDHPDTLAELYRSAAQNGVRGIVVAATGNGSLTPGALEGVSRAHRLGVTCVRASRIHAGPVTDSAYDQDHHTIAAHWLPAQKARILLMLGLAAQLDEAELQERFQAC